MSEPESAWIDREKLSVAIALCIGGSLAAIPNQIIWMRKDEVLIDYFGVIYGVAIAVTLLLFFRQPVWKMLAFIGISGLSWFAALNTAFYLLSNAGESILLAVAFGCLAGAVGAGILAFGFAAIYPRFARSQSILRTVAIGTLAALLLMPSIELPIFLFVLFQGGVSFSLGMDRNVFD